MQVYRDLRILTARPTPAGGGAGAAPALRPCRRRGELLRRTLSARRRSSAGGGAPHAACRSSSAARAFTSRPSSKASPTSRPCRGGARARPRRGRGPRKRGAPRRARGARSGDGAAPQAERPPAHPARARGGRGGRESLLAFQGRRRPGLLGEAASVRLFLAPERDALRPRIDARFVAMIERGAIEEVRALGRRRLDPMLPAMHAHGVPGLLAHLRGKSPRASDRPWPGRDALAKRQFTWFRHQMPGWTAVAPRRRPPRSTTWSGASGRSLPVSREPLLHARVAEPFVAAHHRIAVLAEKPRFSQKPRAVSLASTVRRLAPRARASLSSASASARATPCAAPPGGRRACRCDPAP